VIYVLCVLYIIDTVLDTRVCSIDC